MDMEIVNSVLDDIEDLFAEGTTIDLLSRLSFQRRLEDAEASEETVEEINEMIKDHNSKLYWEHTEIIQSIQNRMIEDQLKHNLLVGF